MGTVAKPLLVAGLWGDWRLADSLHTRVTQEQADALAQCGAVDVGASEVRFGDQVGELLAVCEDGRWLEIGADGSIEDGGDGLMATYTLVVQVPDEMTQDELIEAVDGCGSRSDLCGAVVAFCGPGSLVQDVEDDAEPVREVLGRWARRRRSGPSRRSASRRTRCGASSRRGSGTRRTGIVTCLSAGMCSVRRRI